MDYAPTSIHDLPNEILDYIFSYLNFVQRARIEVICKRWHMIGGLPTQLYLRADYLHNRNLDDIVLGLILIPRGPTLKEFTLKACTDLTIASIANIGEYCPHLVVVELHLIGNAQLSCLKALAPHWLHLQVLRLTSYGGDAGIYNEGLLAVAESCKALKCLHVAHLQTITITWLRAINPDLQTFCLYDTSLNPEALLCLMRRCSKLQVFTLDDCELLNGQVLCEFLIYLKRTLIVLRIKHLVSCFVRWCKALQELVRLEVLQLFACENVNDNVMKVLANKCVKLRFLDIGSTDVTDIGLQELQNMPSLKELKMGWKTLVTDKGLESLVAKGILRRVTIPPQDDSLQQVCRNMAITYPNVHFVTGLQVRFPTVESSFEAEEGVADSSWFI